MNSIFSDTKFHEKLEEDGFIKIQLLNTAEISKLMNLYDNIKQTHKDKASRLFVSSRDCFNEFRMNIFSVNFAVVISS